MFIALLSEASAGIRRDTILKGIPKRQQKMKINNKSECEMEGEQTSNSKPQLSILSADSEPGTCHKWKSKMICTKIFIRNRAQEINFGEMKKTLKGDSWDDVLCTTKLLTWTRSRFLRRSFFRAKPYSTRFDKLQTRDGFHWSRATSAGFEAHEAFIEKEIKSTEAL